MAVTAMSAKARALPRALASLLAQCEADTRFCARHSQVTKQNLIG
jgi:hypothetical protein